MTATFVSEDLMTRNDLDIRLKKLGLTFHFNIDDLHNSTRSDPDIITLRNESDGPQRLQHSIIGPQTSQRSNIRKQDRHRTRAMHAVLHMGSENVHAHFLLATDAESPLQPLYQDSHWIRRAGLCCDYDLLLRSLLPTLLPVLGYACLGHAMRNLSILLNHPSRVQHFFRRNHVRDPDPAPRPSSIKTASENPPHRRHESRSLHYRRCNPKQILQLCLPSHNNLPDLVYPRSKHSHLRRKPDVLVAPPPQTIRLEGVLLQQQSRTTIPRP